MRVALLLLDLLIELLPTAFRKSYAHEIRADFVDHWNDRVQSHPGVRRTLRLTGLLVTAYGNLLLINITERVTSSASPHGKRSKMTTKRHVSRTTGSTLRQQSDSLLQDVRYAVRGLLRQPGFTASVILLLAIGIGANVAMFSALHQALLKPLPFAEPENLVLGRSLVNGNVNPDMSAPDCYDFSERSQVLESAGIVRSAPMFATVTGGEEPERLSALVVSWDLFPTLGVPPVAGRYFSPSEGELGGPSVVMISGGYWQRRFGGAPDAVGSTITVDGTVQTIVGVMPSGFEFMHDADLWMPLHRNDPTMRANWRGWHSWFLVGRLRRGVTIETAQADLDLIAAQLASEFPNSNRDKNILVTELQEMFTEDYQTTVFLLMAAVGLVLLIACGNVASLLLARGAARRSELSVRAALGASSGRLVRQLLTESLVTAAAGGALGVILAFYFQKLVVYAVPGDALGMDSLGVSWPMLAFALGLSAITGVLFGVLPAIQAARSKIADDMRSGTRSTDSRGQRVQKGLVITQVAISTILLIGAGLLLKSFVTLLAVEPGFDTENLMTADIQIASDKYPDASQRILFFSSLQENLEAIPGVSDVAVVNQLPIRNPGNNFLVNATERPPDDPNDRQGAFWRSIFPGYFAAMRIPLRHGRGIEPSDHADAPPVMVINETMARKLFPDQDPLGQRVTVSRGNAVFEVVGVVGDIRNEGAKYSQRMTMYLPYMQFPTLTMCVGVRTAIDPVSLAAEMRDAVWKSDRDVPVTGIESMEAITARSVSDNKVVAFSVALFAAVAVLLAALGIYGVLAYYVNRRQHEIGIKVALGADRGQIMRPILSRGLSLVVVGIGLGLIGAFWTARVLQRLLFDVAPTDAPTFVFVSLFFGCVALVACLIPARRALRVDPVTVLATQ